MNRNLPVIFLLCVLHAGSLLGQAPYSYAKAKTVRSGSQTSLKSIRLYNDMEGQVLFIRRTKVMKDQETWRIYDEPGGAIQFFADQSPTYASISLGQAKVEVKLLQTSPTTSPTWQMALPGDTVFFQSRSALDPSVSAHNFRLYKKVRPHSAILATPEEVEVDLLHFQADAPTPSIIQMESQESLEDYSQLFPIMCIMMIFRIQFGT